MSGNCRSILKHQKSSTENIRSVYFTLHKLVSLKHPFQITDIYTYKKLFLIAKILGMGCSSIAKCLFSMHKALGLMPSTTEENKTKLQVETAECMCVCLCV
jgi:hypothetical protein